MFERLRGIADTLHATEYELIVYSVANNEQLQHYVDMLSASKRVDGLIVMTLPVDETALKRLKAQRIEIVCIEVPNPLCSTITVNNFWGGALAAQHLVDKGYCRFAYIGEPFQLSENSGTGNSEKRLQGFQAGLQENGMRLDDEYIRLAPYSMICCYRANSILARFTRSRLMQCLHTPICMLLGALKSVETAEDARAGRSGNCRV